MQAREDYIGVVVLDIGKQVVIWFVNYDLGADVGEGIGHATARLQRDVALVTNATGEHQNL